MTWQGHVGRMWLELAIGTTLLLVAMVACAALILQLRPRAASVTIILEVRPRAEPPRPHPLMRR